jgi:hypothetical protein
MEVVDEGAIVAPIRAVASVRGNHGAIFRRRRGLVAPVVGQDAMAHGPKHHGSGVTCVSAPLCLFKDEGGAGLQEHGERDLKGQKRTHMSVSFNEASKERKNQGVIADGFLDVGERVGEVLELGAVVADGEVA